MPKVSIITSVYNVEQYIKDCIESVLGQTLTSFEFILVDDCSPDKSVEIIKSYNDPRIKLIQHETNRGCGQARVTGLKYATGEYTFFLDSDDWLHSNCLSNLYTVAERDKADVVNCRVLDYRQDMGKENSIDEHFVNFIQNKLIKRSLWDKVEYCGLRYREDINTLWRILESAENIVSIPYVGVYYRFRPNSLTTSKRKTKQQEEILFNALAIIENIEWAKGREIKSEFFKKVYCTENLKNLLHYYNRDVVKDLYPNEVTLLDNKIKELHVSNNTRK